jgi:hypothetical protein
MTFRCADLERALADDDPAQVAAARAHAESCSACREELRIWDEISVAARTMRRRWESPALWARIEGALDAPNVRRGARRIPSWVPLAAAAALVIATGTAWKVTRRPPEPPATGETPLLGTRALADVEQAEADYQRALDRLSSVAAPRLDRATSPLLLTLRERLVVLDAAIAQCRSEIERNRFNAHLRRELLEMYRDKRRTLEEIINAPTNPS